MKDLGKQDQLLVGLIYACLLLKSQPFNIKIIERSLPLSRLYDGSQIGCLKRKIDNHLLMSIRGTLDLHATEADLLATTLDINLEEKLPLWAAYAY